jgi:hypothetical protein
MKKIDNCDSCKYKGDLNSRRCELCEVDALPSKYNWEWDGVERRAQDNKPVEPTTKKQRFCPDCGKEINECRLTKLLCGGGSHLHNNQQGG